MFRILESQAPAKQTATDTINVLSNRLQSATLLEDRRAAILGLRSFAKTYPASVASGALRDLISSIRRDAEDVDTIKVVLETLLTLFSPDENSPEASDEIVLWLADEFTQRQDNITALLDLLDSNDFYSRLYALQLMSQIFAARPDRTQECVFTAPLGISRLVSVLDDAREPVRNEALVLLIALTYSSGELQKLVAFENAFERTFSLIKAEGSISQGSEVVEDCLSLLANLLRLNVSNQSYFRETGCVKNLTALLLDATRAPEEEAELPVWTVARIEKNLWGLLSIIQLFLARGSISTPVNQTTFWQNGIMEQVLRIAFSRNFSAKVTSKALETCADLIRGNSTLQEKFADVEVTWYNAPSHDKAPNGHPEYIRINVIEALLKLALEPAPISALDTRLAASECLKAFFANHPGIRLHVLRRAIDGHISGNDQIPNILSVVLESPEGRGVVDPYRKWIAAVLMFHLLFEDPEAKALAMKVTEGNAEEGEEVITCVQSVAGNLVTGMQRGDDERISVAYIMLLSGWLFEDPDVVNDFLSEGSTLQTLIQGIKHSPTGSVLLPGLCSALLGIIYEFSTKDSPIPRATLHEILMSKLGREQYIDKITRLREDPLVRDFEVLPQIARSDHDGGLPEVFFDRTFVDFLKDNFSRLIRAIDRDPGIEVPVITNGIQKGISRELVDSLRAQVDERNQTIQKLEADLLGFQQKLDQEQLDHRRTKDSSNLELTRIKQINEALQKNHETELAQMEEKLRQQRTQLLKQHDEQLRAIDTQLKDTITDYESKGAKLRERYEREVADLRKTVEELRASLDRANKEHSSELQTAREEASARYANLEARTKKMEQDLEKEKSRVAQLEQELKETRDALNQAKAEVESKERARKQTQDELDDLLIVFSDLEAKRKEDKKRLKELGQEVSEPEDEEDEDEDEEEAE